MKHFVHSMQGLTNLEAYGEAASGPQISQQFHWKLK
jgi:hypothetical protein